MQNHERIVSAGHDCNHDPDRLLTTRGRFASNFPFGELDHPHHANPAGSRLPESCSDVMAGIRSRAAVAPDGRDPRSCVSLGTGIRAFLVMLCLGILLVELCLYTFPKIPFTCSYLPGKAQIDFVFWACLMLIFRLLNEGAEIESRMLRHVLSCTGLILIAAIAAGAMRWLSESRASSTEDLLFEEEYSSEVTSLKLN